MISDPQMGQMKVGYFITKFPALSYNSKDAKHPIFSDIFQVLLTTTNIMLYFN